MKGIKQNETHEQFHHNTALMPFILVIGTFLYPTLCFTDIDIQPIQLKLF